MIILICPFFLQISTLASVWPWLSDELVPFLFPTRTYTGSALDAYPSLFTQGGACYRLSGLILRQARIDRGTTHSHTVNSTHVTYMLYCTVAKYTKYEIIDAE